MSKDPMAEDELWLERAKKLMEWNEDRYGDPTILEYLRYWKNGTIKERHIEAAINAYTTNKIIEARGGLDKPSDTASVGGNQVDKLSLEAYQLEDELFKMVYQWGRGGMVVDFTCPAFQDKLKEVLEAYSE